MRTMIWNEGLGMMPVADFYSKSKTFHAIFTINISKKHYVDNDPERVAGYIRCQSDPDYKLISGHAIQYNHPTTRKLAIIIMIVDINTPSQ